MKTRLALAGGAIALGPILMMACGGSVDSAAVFGHGATSSGATSSGTTSSSSGSASSSSGAGGSSSSSTSSTSSSSTSTSTSSTSSTSTSTSSTSTSSGMACGGPNDDKDIDGWTPAQGDCDDCNAGVNPGAVELQNGLDDDCNGQKDDLPQPCDQGIALDTADPGQAVKAVDLCKVSLGPKDWGVTGAKWVLADGTPPPAADPALANFHLGHGVLPGLGPNVHVQLGQNMLGLSSGTARAPTDPGYQSVGGFDKAYTSNSPMGFPKESPACPGIVTGAPHDPTGLEVTIKVPSNASGFSFDSNFFTYEWPSYICSQYNDFFVAILSPTPLGQADGDIAFDTMGNPISVNNGLLSACGCMAGPPCLAGGKSFACPLGTASLVGTGFDEMGTFHASTSWLVTSAPAKASDTITLRWAVYDSGDGVLDTTTLIDHWQWLAAPNVAVGTIASPNPK